MLSSISDILVVVVVYLKDGPGYVVVVHDGTDITDQSWSTELRGIHTEKSKPESMLQTYLLTTARGITVRLEGGNILLLIRITQCGLHLD